MTQSRKTLPWLLSLLCCVGLFVSTPGCGLLFPNGPAPAPAPAPDDGKKPAPNDQFSARSGLAAALQKDTVSKGECVLLYGVFAGTADFVSGQPSDTDLTTTGLGEKMAVMLAEVGWPHDKYTNVKAEISRVWNAMGFKETPAQLSDSAAKQKLVTTYRNMAAGAKDAASLAK